MGATPDGGPRPDPLDGPAPLRAHGARRGGRGVRPAASRSAEADLAALALEWRIRPVPVGAGRLWEVA
ncbi:MAG: hypothetical protein WKF40_11120 [Thermoleophilaceae bacterium]